MRSKANAPYILVEGRVETGEKGYFNLVVDRVVFGIPPAAKGAAAGKQTTQK